AHQDCVCTEARFSCLGGEWLAVAIDGDPTHVHLGDLDLAAGQLHSELEHAHRFSAHLGAHAVAAERHYAQRLWSCHGCAPANSSRGGRTTAGTWGGLISRRVARHLVTAER